MSVCVTMNRSEADEPNAKIFNRGAEDTLGQEDVIFSKPKVSSLPSYFTLFRSNS